MKKVLVTGAGGFVGARAAEQLADRFEVSVFSRGTLASAGDGEILSYIHKVSPDVIIHSAAISDVGYSEQHPEDSYRANVMLPVLMAKGAKETGAKLLAFSSDQVYTGLNGCEPYDEAAVLSPANVYGRHKLEAENRVLDILPDAVMLRATWMYDLMGYGLPIRGNFVLNLISAAIHNEEIKLSASDYRGITYVRQVIELLIPAMELPGGVYNFGSENRLDMYETGCIFVKALGLGASVSRLENMPMRNISMSCEKIKKYGICFDDTASGIKRLIKDYAFDRL